ncbi:hypothetical protein ACIQM4_05660 [Streptomyces sp. NPDC091272]|uniref:hypothetical protein n=1 Tax=Streptomyces sp. NPDC091272 TaxID=3365981 RepID=UPI0037F139ED
MRSARVGAAGTGAMVVAALCGLLLAGCGEGAAGGPATGKPSGPEVSVSDSGNGPSGAASPSTVPPAPASTPPSAPPSTEVPPSVDPAPSASVPAQTRRLVAATVSGGIDGRHRSVLVNSDGTYTTLDRKKPPRSGRMRPAQLAELRAALAASDFAKLPRVSRADPPVMDGVTTAIIYDGHEVATDGMKKIPKLDRVVAALPGLG